MQNSDGSVISESGKYIGIATNNVAEYSALILGLEKAIDLDVTEIDCFSDSELMVRQLNGQYRVKDPKMRIYHSKVKNICNAFKNITFTSVRREKNRLADKLVNEAIDSSFSS